MESDHYKEVDNTADMFERLDEEDTTYDVDTTCKKFWHEKAGPDSLSWYNEGKTIASLNTSKTGNDILMQIVNIAIPHIIKRYMRDNSVSISEKLSDLLDILDVINKTIIDDSINTININKNKLEQEDVVAFLQGFMNDKYDKTRYLHED